MKTRLKINKTNIFVEDDTDKMIMYKIYNYLFFTINITEFKRQESYLRK